MNSPNIFSSELAEEKALEIDIGEILQLLKRKLLLILLAAIVFASAGYVYFRSCVTPRYTSKATIYIDADYGEMDATVAITLATNLAKDYPYIIASTTTMDMVAKNLNLSVSGAQLKGSVSATMPGDEAIRTLMLSFTYTDPQLAADILNETISVFSERLSYIAQYAKIKVAVIDPASVPSAPSTKGVRTYVFTGALIGVALMSLFFIVLRILDDKIKSEHDIEKYLELNVLALVPAYEQNSKKKGLKYLLSSKTGKERSKNKTSDERGGDEK